MKKTGTATIEVLTAEVRVLMVGTRQVTLSVFRQLDAVPFHGMRPFGRVNDGPPRSRWKDAWGYWQDGDPQLWLIGADRSTGHLVRCQLTMPDMPDEPKCGIVHEAFPEEVLSRHMRAHAEYDRALDEWMIIREQWENVHKLPLIVLAGLR